MRLPPRAKSTLPAFCLVIALLILIALAPHSGGSFSVAAEPQDPTGSEAFRAAESVSVLPFGSALLPVSAYRAEPCTDFGAYCRAGAEVMRTLALYPEGFFEAVSEYAGGVVIELCAGIRSEGSMPDLPAAVTADCLSFRLILLKAEASSAGCALMHELCHVIDSCLDRAAENDPSHWNEADWNALNPEGFAYHNSYSPSAIEGGETKYAAEAPFDPADVFFINRYSMTFPTEDRAVAFETMMRVSPSADCMQSPHIRAKLKYYFEAIRYYLGSDEWPDKAFWEERLENLE